MINVDIELKVCYYTVVRIKNIGVKNMDNLLQISKTEIDIGLSKEYRFFQISDAHMANIDEQSSDVDHDEYKRSHGQWDTLKIDMAKDAGEFCDDRYNVEANVLFEKLARYALDFGADALILSGDIMDRVSESNIRYLKKFKSEYKIPVIYCPGNHAYTDEYGNHNKKMYERFVGLIDNPDFDIYDYGELEIITVDNGTKQITKDQIKKLKIELEKEKKLILVLHAPLNIGKFGEEARRSLNSYFLMPANGDCEESFEFTRLVEENSEKFICVLAGHIHRTMEYPITDKLMQYTTSSALIGYGREIIIK